MLDLPVGCSGHTMSRNMTESDLNPGSVVSWYMVHDRVVPAQRRLSIERPDIGFR